MPELDIRTLFFVVLFFSTFYAAGMALFAQRMKAIQSLHSLALADGLIAVATLLITLRNIVSPLLSVIVANTLLVASIGITYHACMTFRNIPRNRYYLPLIVTLTVLHIAVFFYFTNISPNINARIVFISLEFCAVFLFITEIIYRKGEKHLQLGPRSFAFIPLLFSFFYIFRAAYSFKESPLQSFMQAGLVHSISVLSLFLFIAWKNYLFVYATAARMVDTLDIVSKHDPLTQILNRRGLEEAAEIEISRAKRYGHGFSVILCDLDKFKPINDTYGHEAGDEVLVSFATMLCKQTRTTDICARLGGEEFIVILPNADKDGVLRSAELLREKCSNLTFGFNKDLQITASFGVATYAEDMTFIQLMHRADEAMYQAKHFGRNRVVSRDDLKIESRV